MNPVIPHYEIIGSIGHGSFAEVYKARHKETNDLYAIKVIDMSRMKGKLRSNLLNEIEILTTLAHPNIVRLVETQLAEKLDVLYIVMEYCNSGTLMGILRKKERLPLEMARKFVKDIHYGMMELRKSGIIHRDLKPQNILVHKEESSDLKARASLPILKIADFGFAKILQEDFMTDTVCGTPAYMAPEVMKGEKYTPLVDLWSIGLLFYELLCGSFPFNYKSYDTLIKSIQEGHNKLVYPADVPKAYVELVNGLLQPDPNKRMNFDAFFSHKAFQMGTISTPGTPNFVSLPITPFKNIMPRSYSESHAENIDIQVTDDFKGKGISKPVSALTVELSNSPPSETVEKQKDGQRSQIQAKPEKSQELKKLEEVCALVFCIAEITFQRETQGEFLAACSMASLALDLIKSALKGMTPDAIEQKAFREDEIPKIKEYSSWLRKCYGSCLNILEIDFKRVPVEDMEEKRKVHVEKIIMERVIGLGREGVEKEGADMNKSSQMYYNAVVLLNYLSKANTLTVDDKTTINAYIHEFIRRLSPMRARSMSNK